MWMSVGSLVSGLGSRCVIAPFSYSNFSADFFYPITSSPLNAHPQVLITLCQPLSGPFIPAVVVSFLSKT